jgi:hypothetical protein
MASRPKHVVSTNNKKVNDLVTLMDNKEQILSAIRHIEECTLFFRRLQMHLFVKEISSWHFEASSKLFKLLEQPNRKRKVILPMFFEVYSNVTVKNGARIQLTHAHRA